MSNRLIDQSYWDSKYQTFTLQAAGLQDGVRQWLENILTFNNISSGRCFEIGCYPGRYLPVFGERGMELNGIDLTPGVSHRLPEWLQLQGYLVGEFFCSDFASFDVSNRYDVVISFGFIEHFKDWESILLKQAEHVANDGWLIVCVPNFRGIIQRLLHVYLDNENMSRHNIEAMDLRNWRRVVQKAGFRLVFTRYFGGFDFWVNNQARTPLQTILLTRIARALPLLRNIRPDCRMYSPYCGLVAQRQKRH